MKEGVEKENFFKSLPAKLPSVPKPVAQKKLLPMVGQALEFGGAPPSALGAPSLARTLLALTALALANPKSKRSCAHWMACHALRLKRVCLCVVTWRHHCIVHLTDWEGGIFANAHPCDHSCVVQVSTSRLPQHCWTPITKVITERALERLCVKWVSIQGVPPTIRGVKTIRCGGYSDTCGLNGQLVSQSVSLHIAATVHTRDSSTIRWCLYGGDAECASTHAVRD